MRIKLEKILFLGVFVFVLTHNLYSQQNKILKPEDLAMPRQQINFDDSQIILFNGRGFINVAEYSMTNFKNVKFLPIDIWDYSFHFNFLDNKSGKLIQDDIPALWDQWIRTGTGTDPLGANFRHNFATVLVTQDEIWQPNCYSRTGIFHKQYDGRWVSFSMKTWTSVSGVKDEIFLKIELRNRTDQPLELTLIPEQSAKELSLHGSEGSKIPNKKDPFTFSSEQLAVIVSSDIQKRTDKGFLITLQPNQKEIYHFAIQPISTSKKKPKLYQSNISKRMNAAYNHTCKRLTKGFSKMPVIKSDYKLLEEFYNRSLLTVLECKWERDNFIVNPFWAVGAWPFTISWDNSYAADVLAMLDPESLKEAILVDFREGEMKKTYIGWAGAFWEQIYIQEPFALQTMIEAYLRHTGDISILDAKAGDATVYEWMKRWVYELHDNYGRQDGLIDVGHSTEKIIEIRTDGYNHVVPIVNGLTVKLYNKMAEWAEFKKDDDGEKFILWANETLKSINEKLWNEEKGWFDNLYTDGSKGTVWTYHLFDLLDSDVLSPNQYNRLTGHIREGVFLGKFGFYSIARNDTLHWDRIDADWGGGGQYAGMPGRIARNLYQTGNSELGWNVLKRYMGYFDYFPYMSQNPRTDRPFQDQSSSALQISAGAGVEAVMFGIFGLRCQQNGTVIIRPACHTELGTSEMRGFQFRGDSYDVLLYPDKFEVFVNNKLLGSRFYGEQVTVNK